MNYPRVIGVCGKMGAGKDTVGDILRDTHGYLKTSFAHELRTEVQEALMKATADAPLNRRLYFPVIPSEKYDATDMACRAFLKILTEGDTSTINTTGKVDFGVWTKPTSAPMRVLLQWWGTEYRREEDQDYWIKKWLSSHIGELIDGERLCICDVRYNNEAAMCKLMGAIWEVYGRHVENEGLKDHASEKGVNLVFDMYLPNQGTMETLTWAVRCGVR